MADPDRERVSKEERRRLRVEAARRRTLWRRLRLAMWPLALLVPLVLYSYETRGPQELVEAEVVETQRYRHVPRDGQAHDHTRAILLIEGVTRTTLDKADGYQRGQRVPVWIRRGRLTGRPSFLDFAAEDESVEDK